VNSNEIINIDQVFKNYEDITMIINLKIRTKWLSMWENKKSNLMKWNGKQQVSPSSSVKNLINILKLYLLIVAMPHIWISMPSFEVYKTLLHQLLNQIKMKAFIVYIYYIPIKN